MRLGSFVISKRVIDENPEEVQKIFCKVIPLRAEFMAYSLCIEYVGLSLEFDEVEFGSIPPKYYDEVQEDGSFTFKKLK